MVESTSEPLSQRPLSIELSRLDADKSGDAGRDEDQIGVQDEERRMRPVKLPLFYE